MLKDDDLFLRWDGTVWHITKSLTRQFPGIDLDELYQNLWLFVMENYADGHPDDDWVLTNLYRWAKILAWDNRVEQLRRTDQYFYRPVDIRRFLEVHWDDEAWITPPDDARTFRANGKGPVHSNTADGAFDQIISQPKFDDPSDNVVMHADIDRALKILSRTKPKMHAAILRRYRDKVVPEPSSAEERRTYRAVDRLTDTINYAFLGKDYIGTRTVMSNNTAQYVIRNQWED